MPVKVSKLWGNSKFLNLTNNSKLFYVYLATCPHITHVGTCNLNLDIIKIQLNLTQDEIRNCSSELIENKYIKVYKEDGEIYFVVLAHFDSLPKSDGTILRVNKALDELPSGLKTKLINIGIRSDRKAVVFNAPTKEQVTDFGLSNGYKLDADTIISFYSNKGKQLGKDGLWFDSRGKQVKDWRAKIRTVWFKDESKLKEVDGAPKGYEHFYIDFEGKIAYPDSWRDGKPISKNFVVSIALQKEYEKRTKSSK